MGKTSDAAISRPRCSSSHQYPRDLASPGTSRASILCGTTIIHDGHHTGLNRYRYSDGALCDVFPTTVSIPAWPLHPQPRGSIATASRQRMIYGTRDDDNLIRSQVRLDADRLRTATRTGSNAYKRFSTRVLNVHVRPHADSTTHLTY